jgi:hypothetical protein
VHSSSGRTRHARAPQIEPVSVCDASHVRLTPPLPRNVPKSSARPGVREGFHSLCAAFPVVLAHPMPSKRSRQVPSAASCSLWPDMVQGAAAGAAGGLSRLRLPPTMAISGNDLAPAGACNSGACSLGGQSTEPHSKTYSGTYYTITRRHSWSCQQEACAKLCYCSNMPLFGASSGG